MSSNSIVSSPKGGGTTYNFNCYKNIKAHFCINLKPYWSGRDKDHEITSKYIANEIATVVSIIFSNEKDVSEAGFQDNLGSVMINLEDFGFNDPQKVKTIIEKILKKPDLSSSSSSSPLSLQVPKASISSPEESLVGQSAGSHVPVGTRFSSLSGRDYESGLGLGFPCSERSLTSSFSAGSSECYSVNSADVFSRFCPVPASYDLLDTEQSITGSKSSMNSFYGTYMKQFLYMLVALFALLVVFIRKNRT